MNQTDIQASLYQIYYIQEKTKKQLSLNPTGFLPACLTIYKSSQPKPSKKKKKTNVPPRGCFWIQIHDQPVTKAQHYHRANPKIVIYLTAEIFFPMRSTDH